MISTQVLPQIDLFAGFSERLLAIIAGLCEEISCVEVERLFRESEKGKHLYFLLKGQIALQVQLSSHLENLTVAVINSSGQSIGLVKRYRSTLLDSFGPASDRLPPGGDLWAGVDASVGQRARSGLHRDAAHNRADQQSLAEQSGSFAANLRKSAVMKNQQGKHPHTSSWCDLALGS
jgi:hypothetical protein